MLLNRYKGPAERPRSCLWRSRCWSPLGEGRNSGGGIGRREQAWGRVEGVWRIRNSCGKSGWGAGLGGGVMKVIAMGHSLESPWGLQASTVPGHPSSERSQQSGVSTDCLFLVPEGPGAHWGCDDLFTNGRSVASLFQRSAGEVSSLNSRSE